MNSSDPPAPPPSFQPAHSTSFSDLLRMMFLCLCLGKINSSTNRPDALFDNGKMTFKQFIHGLR
jgi:hypothetical protein